MVLHLRFKITIAAELFKSLANVKNYWKKQTPWEKWCYLYSIGKVPFDIAGPSLFQDSVKRVGWFYYTFLANSSFLVSLSLYTLCYYQYYGEPQKALASTCMASVMLAVSEFFP